VPVRVLITAGPTREPLDPVRFLSNYSTGVMGFACARAAQERGHQTVLVLGPVEAQPPVGVEVRAVETARDMLAAVLEELPRADAVVCTAAVCDYRPTERSEAKIKRGSLHAIELVENPDIAAEIGQRRGETPCAIFALETGDGAAEAMRKLETKNADVCVLNSPEAIGARSARFSIFARDGSRHDLGEVGKDEVARVLLDALGI